MCQHVGRPGPRVSDGEDDHRAQGHHPIAGTEHSGLRRIFIATQYKSLSLNRHIRLGWSVVSEELGEFVEILPPQKRVSEHWYQGAADAVFQNLYSIVQEAPHHVIVLSGDAPLITPETIRSLL